MPAEENEVKDKMNPPTMPELVTLAVAAEMLGCGDKTVRRMIARGEIAARRIGPRMLRVEAASLAEVGRPVSIAATR